MARTTIIAFILVLFVGIFLTVSFSDPSIANKNFQDTNEIKLTEGSGSFLVEGGEGRTEKTIRIFYHQPKNFNSNSRVLFVLHGAGRNGDDYRDAWVKASEKYNVLVLAPVYSDNAYPQFWNYNLAGMLKDVRINAERTAMTDFTISQNPNDWIFNDFDRIFEVVEHTLQLKRKNYDMFGHSAGGQVLHRLAIFRPNSKADRILASNSGWYTVPDDNENFPVGLKNSNKISEQVDFSTNLVLFLGEKDDANETRGDIRHTPELDKQGLHRLARGTYFYNTSKHIAEHLGKDFNWKIEVIPGIGHDYVEMSKAAASYLYE
ncbi:hypothetical protein [Winogradskyella sp.]|uniref:hypothetical protein n=1 Tax=Winogradskyella sp. TaxID=1883156 RepID=UPI0026300CC6|nr:hypothetical protein [Winogradskyella sp.]